MADASASRRHPRKIAKFPSQVSADPLPLTAEIAPVLCGMWRPSYPQEEPGLVRTDSFVWTRDSSEFRSLPYISGDRYVETDYLAGHGHAVIFENRRQIYAPGTRQDIGSESLGLFKYDLPTGKVLRANYDPSDTGADRPIVSAASPDGTSLVVAHSFLPDADPPAVDALTSYTTVDFDGREPARTIGIYPGGVHDDGFARSIHWSPDGTRLAVGVGVLPQHGNSNWRRSGTLLIDLATGQHTLHHNIEPLGSQAWSPDGNRLLVHNVSEDFYLWDLTTDTRTPFDHPGLHSQRGYDVQPDGKTFLIQGFATDEHLLYSRERGTTTYLGLLRISDGDLTPLIRWTDKHTPFYPVTTHIPPEYWLDLAGTRG